MSYPAMAVSRIPIPIRHGINDDAHVRAISAKTRLERLREEFQRKLLWEKEVKLLDFCDKQRLESVYQDDGLRRRGQEGEGESRGSQQRFGSGDQGYGQYGRAGLTTHFFYERMNVGEDKSGVQTLPSGRSQNLMNGFSRKPPRPAYGKRGAGWDRGRPLAPIGPVNPARKTHQSRKDGWNRREQEGQSLGPSLPDELSNTYTLVKDPQKQFLPRPPEAIPRPPAGGQPTRRNRRVTHRVIGGEGEEQNRRDSFQAGESKGGSVAPTADVEKLKREKMRQFNDRISKNRINPHPATKEQESDDRGPMDFQRWQQEQNEERDDRLRRMRENEKKTSRNDDEVGSEEEDEDGDDASAFNGTGRKSGRIASGKRSSSGRPITFEPADNGESEDEKEVLRRKLEILRQHNRMKSGEVVAQAKRDETDEEDESDEDGDGDDVDDDEDYVDSRLEQKEKQLQQLIRKQEEELERLRQGKTADRNEEERKNLENKKRQRLLAEQRKGKVAETEESGSAPRKPSLRLQSVPPTPDTTSNLQRTHRVSDASLPPKQTWKPTVDPNNEETAFYLERAIENGGDGAGAVRLEPCRVCGRSFAAERLRKHGEICAKKAASKKRKVFDYVTMRYKGTDFENHVKKVRSAAEDDDDDNQKGKKSYWKMKHKNFIDTIRYAKKVAKVESEGGNVSTLPPPPVTENPDYIQCPHCQRRFNEKAADRHISWCKDKKSNQPIVPRGRK